MIISFRAKILLLMTLIITISSIILCMFYLKRSEEIVERSYVNNIQDTMAMSKHTFEQMVQSAYNLSVKLSFDIELNKLIQSYNNNSKDNKYIIELYTYLLTQSKKSPYIDSIYVYLPNKKQVITSVDYHMKQEMFYPSNHSWLTQWNSKRKTSLTPELITNNISRIPKRQLAYVRPIYDEDHNIISTIAILINERQLFYQCLSPIGSNQKNLYYLLHKEGFIVSTYRANIVGEDISCIEQVTITDLQRKENNGFIKIKDKIFAYTNSSMTGYIVLTVIERINLTILLQQQQLYILLVFFGVIITMITITYFTSQQMYRPIKNLQNTMSQVKAGDLTARVEILSKDEMGQLSKDFNDMLCHIEILLDQIIKGESEKKLAELEALQYQITPHFMYNTLNAIKYAANMYGVNDVAEQLGAFIELLQASISKKGAFLSVQDEINLTKNFVKLIQFRYMEEVDIQFDIDKSTMRYYVPRLILQPLVENAILYGGSENNQYTFKINVKVYIRDKYIIFTVKDYGKGMKHEQLSTIKAGNYKVKGQFSCIGIYNITERLRLYYGENAHLIYSNKEQIGTLVELKIPLTHREDVEIKWKNIK